MIDNFSHNNLPIFPPILGLTKKTYKIWLQILRNFPKTERFGIGAKIDQYFLTLLENLRSASLSSPETKIPQIKKALKNIDSIRFFLQLCWEANLIPTKRYSYLGPLVEDIGKKTGGWKKDLEIKTSQRREEKSE